MARPKLLEIITPNFSDTAYSKLVNNVKVTKSGDTLVVEDISDIQDKATLVFRAPCNSTGIKTLTICNDKYTLIDALTNEVGDISDLFSSNALVTVSIDTEEMLATIDNTVNNSKLDALEYDIIGLNTDIENLDGAISKVNTTLSDLSKKISTNEGNITQLDTKLGDISSDIIDIDNQINGTLDTTGSTGILKTLEYMQDDLTSVGDQLSTIERKIGSVDDDVNIGDQLEDLHTSIDLKSTVTISEISTSATTHVLTKGGWSSSTPYSQTITADVKSTDTLLVDAYIVASNGASVVKNRFKALSCVDMIQVNNGNITAYCFNKKPSVDLPLRLTRVRVE